MAFSLCRPGGVLIDGHDLRPWSARRRGILAAQFRLEWTSTEANSFLVELSEDLASGEWSVLGEDIPGAAGSSGLLLDAGLVRVLEM